MCVPGACDDDRLAARVRARTYTNLVLCDGAADRYTFLLGADEGLRVVLRHAPDDGDLALELVAGVDPVGRSDDLYGVEALGVDPSPVQREIEIIVTGRPGQSVVYALSVERLGADACLPDPNEGLLGNDDAAHATRVGLGDHRAVLCPNDEDWLEVGLPAGARFEVFAFTNGDAEALGLTIHEAGGAQIAEAEAGLDSLTATVDVATSGPRHLRLHRNQPEERVDVNLTLGVSAAPDAAALACADAQVLEAGVPLRLPATVFVPRLSLSCGDPGEDAEHILRFELQADAHVQIELLDTPFAAMALRSDCQDEGTDAVCDFFAEGFALDADLSAGEWFLVIKSNGADRPGVSLQVD